MTDEPGELAGVRRDEANFAEAGSPAALVSPSTTAQVSVALAIASRHAIPVVTRGAGSGLIGGANAVEGCLVVSTARMDAVRGTVSADRTLTVQPGVLTARIRDLAAEHDSFYPPDPGSVEYCTIGGNVATNAGGMCCIKYGVTGDFVRALEVVLADGTILRTGRNTVKGVAGYDLTSLFVGSEGTLGVITEIMLALRQEPSPAATMMATFDTIEAAGAAIGEIIRSGAAPSMLEILDSVTLRAVDSMRGTRISDGVAAMVIAQCDDETAERQIASISEICRGAGAVNTSYTADRREEDELLAARRDALLALERTGGWMLDDVAVPTSEVTELIHRILEISKRTGLTIAVFGHAGDGNLHPTVLFDEGSQEQRVKAEEVFGLLLEAALELGGTITGEHGVGTMKKAWLEREIGAVSLDLHREVKRAFDPSGLLNPGKMF